MLTYVRTWLAVVTATLAATTAAVAQTQPLETLDVRIDLDSGEVTSRARERGVIFSEIVTVPDVVWLRLRFDEVELGRAPAGGEPTTLRITSLFDGAVQLMNAEHVQQWRQTTAYFNGNALLVEIIADPGAEPTRLSATDAWAGPPIPFAERTICGPTDDRVLSNDPRVGRIMPIGCSTWMIDDANHCFLTAGHCVDTGFEVVQFNVPLSNANGTPQNPGPEDQYPIDMDSVQVSSPISIGNDWAYFGCFENSTTGLTPYEAQGAYFVLMEPPPVSGQQIRITGYGTTTPPVPNEWNQAQKTHMGPYYSFVGTAIGYTVDTTGGNSGSPVIEEITGKAIGVHTNGGCGFGGDANFGTGYNNASLLDALANPQGVCVPPTGVDFTYPEGLPELLDPAGDTIRVVLVGEDGIEPEPGTGVLHYDTGEGLVSVPMIEIEPNVYDAVFPAMECGNEVGYHFSAESDQGDTFRDPPAAPSQQFQSLAIVDFDYSFTDDFESDTGWTVVNVDGLTDGAWNRGEPVGGGDRGDPPADADGSGRCFLTDNVDGNSDVDDGATILTSPVMDASQGDPHITYWRWYSNNTGGSPEADIFVVEISSDDGDTWVELETVGPGGPEVGGGWFYKSFRIADVIEPTDQFRIRFTASDLGDGSVVEAGVDGVRLNNSETGYVCSDCLGDLNGDDLVDVTDLLALLGNWGAAGGPGDLDDSGGVDVADLLMLLGAWGDC